MLTFEQLSLELWVSTIHRQLHSRSWWPLGRRPESASFRWPRLDVGWQVVWRDVQSASGLALSLSRCLNVSSSSTQSQSHWQQLSLLQCHTQCIHTILQCIYYFTVMHNKHIHKRHVADYFFITVYFHNCWAFSTFLLPIWAGDRTSPSNLLLGLAASL